jgi:hypothetical protein
MKGAAPEPPFSFGRTYSCLLASRSLHEVQGRRLRREGRRDRSSRCCGKRWHADAQACRGRVQGQDHPASSLTADQDESGVSAGGAAASNFLPTRFVDQVGRKSETTLGIAGLHFEIGAFPVAAPDQFELPPGASNARHRQCGCGKRADPPAGDGRRSAARNRRPRCGGASGGWRCRWCRNFRRLVEDGAMRSWTAARPRRLPDRVIYVEAGDEKSVLVCFEEGLRHAGLPPANKSCR